MTIHTVVAIRDQQLDAYSRPFFTPTPGAAIREFQDEANRPESPVFKHPGDYELIQLATFDDTTGRFTNIEHPKQLATGQMMKQPG